VPAEIPAQAVELCKRFEGFHRVVRRVPVITAAPYICPAGYWTIGWGSLCKRDHPPITEPEGEVLLARDLRVALGAAITYCPLLLEEPPRRMAAIVSFTFNLGGARLKASTLRRRVNTRDWPQARAEIRKWVWGGGRKLPGLVLRREAEAQLL